jgi:tRNA threonylcarbamoyl adenosine modification protein (Sua5/YciO/YrdC/YwlC family)
MVERIMAVERQKIYIDTPQKRVITKAVDLLRAGGIIVYPTDTIYGLGVDLFNKKAMEKILRIKKASNHKLLSFICPGLKNIADWAMVSNDAYKTMRRVTPGAYTFVLKASAKIPKIMLQKRKTVGIRIPNSPIAQALVEELGRPILSASVPQGADGYYTDPEEIASMLANEIDLILDAGVMFNLPSTIIDFSGEEPAILREGAGDINAVFG